MKKKTILIESISLDKETIARLDENQLNGVLGGMAAGTLSCNNATVENQELEIDSCCRCSCNAGGTSTNGE